MTSSSTSTSSTTTQSTTYPFSATEAQEQVIVAHEKQISALESKNATVIATLFEPNATMTWEGDAQVYGGTYSPQNEIKFVYETVMSGVVSYAISNESHIVVPMPDGVLVSWNFTFTGVSHLYGNFVGVVQADDFFVFSGANGFWLISNETWDFGSWSIQYSLGD